MENLTVKKAIQILKDKGIQWSNYFDLKKLELTLKNDKKAVSAIKKIASWLVMG